MIIFDTNIVSEFQKNEPDRRVLAWSDTLNHNEVRMCSIVQAELLAGGEKFRIQTGSMKYLHKLEIFIANLPNKTVLSFDENAARRFGRLKASSQITGAPKQSMDLMIASICLANNAALATRNEKDFDGLGVNVINPFLK